MKRSAWGGAPADVAGAKRRHLGLGVLAAAFFSLLGLPGAATAQVQNDPGTVIQTIDTSLWTPPAPDAAGITYIPQTGELLTCDSEVDEMTLYQGVNLWFHSSTGVVSSTATTLAYSNEPAGIAFDPAGGQLWISDDNAARIFQIDFGPDGLFNTPDDFIIDLDGLPAAGCEDMEDVAYDNVHGHLYISSGASMEICRITPGLDGAFTGAPPTGDDVVITFSLAGLGILDPEGIVYDPFWNTLVLADRRTRALYELTPDGNLLRKISPNFPGGSKPSGVTIAPGSTNPALRNYWVTDRRVDNSPEFPNENDGRIYEIVAVPLGGNGPPVVDAGPAHTLEWPANSVALDGFVSDDGHPYPPSTVLSVWSKLEGPGSVTFENAGSPDTAATFSAPGAYLLQLVGNDSAAQTTDSVAVTVNHTVTLSVSSAGPGSVALDPPGGTYPAGSSVTVTALPEADAAFAGWSGDLAGAASPLLVLMDASKAATASFATLFDVSVAVTGPGAVTLDPPGATYAAGTVVSVTATPGAGAVFDGFSGDLAGTESPQLLTVDGDKSVAASFTQHYALSVASTGPGTVTLDPPGGTYAAGSSVTVTALPDADAAFAGWSGDLAGSENPQLVLMDAAKSATASFATLFDVSLAVTGPGAVTLDPSGGTYAAGSVVSVTATPEANASFDGFSGDLAGTESPQLLTVGGDKSVAASFTQHYTVNVSVSGPGTVTLEPAAASYAAGSVVSVTATPGANASFDGFSGDLAGTDSPQLLTVDGDKSVAASFTQHYALAVAASGPGAMTLDPPGGLYAVGSEVTVSALADPDSAFVGWSGDLAGTDNPQLVVMNADQAATAHFATLFDVSVETTGPGAVTLDPPGGTYPAGSVVTVAAAPELGAILDAFGGSLSGAENPQLLTVAGDETVTASFSLAFFELTATASPGGSVSVDPPTGPYPAGTAVTLTAVPVGGRVFGGWSGDASGKANPLTLVMNADSSVHAAFVGTGGSGIACGMGPELVAALPLLAWLHRRRRR